MWYTVVGIIDSTPLLSLFMEEREMIKKFIAGLMAVSMVFSLCACGQKEDSEKKSNGNQSEKLDSVGNAPAAETTTLHVHYPIAATCTDDSYCDDCYETLAPALGHDYQDGTCTRCGDIDPDSLPVKLHELHVIDKGPWCSYSEEVLTDTFGNTYAGYHWFAEDSTKAFAVYNMNKDYKTFSCDIVVSDTRYSDLDASVFIYVDGREMFQKNGITKRTGPIHVEIDVTGGQQLEIVGMDNNYSYSDVMCVVNAQLFKQ